MTQMTRIYTNRQSQLRSIISHLPWWCLFCVDIIEFILEHTNKKNVLEKITCNYAYTAHLSKEALCAFIGLMFLSGIIKSGRGEVRSFLCSKCKGRSIFRTVMYLFILLCLRLSSSHIRTVQQVYRKLHKYLNMFWACNWRQSACSF